MTEVSNNKRILKNTIMLYLRMIVNMIITLYTARVVLQTLGVVDYGIYGVIGGVLSMFSFFNSSMSGATSRFLTFELGRGDHERLNKTFSTAFIIHCGIAILVAVLCESIGIWFIENKLVIPEDRMTAAMWVFQFSILSMFVSVTQVPYNASIFSHERMDVYAYVEIAHSVLKLLIVYLLVIGEYDKLILYAFLQFAVTLGIALYYRFYCTRSFKECKIYWIWEKPLLRQMLGFSGWDLYGQISVMARTQGVNMLMNMFFGPIMNAATDIATKVQHIVMQLSTNVSIASRPQIVKMYSQSEENGMVDLMRNGARITFVLMMLFCVPLITEIQYILKFWLGDYPEHADVICILTLMWNLVVAMNITVNYGVQATGKVKFVSFASGSLFLMVIPITYFLFMMGCPYWIPYLINVISVIIAPIFGGYTLHNHLKKYSIRKMLLVDNFRDWLALIFTLSISFIYSRMFEEGFVRLIMTVGLSTTLVGITSYFVVFPKASRLKVKSLIIKKLWKKAN